MKRLLQVLGFSFLVLFWGAMPFVISGCGTAPAARMAEYNTIKAVALASKAGMDTAVTLLKSGMITVARFKEVATFHDKTLSPALNIAIAAAQSDLAPASPDLAILAEQFALLVASLTAK